MKKTFQSTILLLTVVIGGFCSNNDLLIRNASVFNSITGTVEKNQDIFINSGFITFVGKSRKSNSAVKIIDAKGKVVTPGFIDVHTHLTHSLGDPQIDTSFKLKIDSSEIYRRKHANLYLPYGVTTVRMVGEPETWIPITSFWQKSPSPNTPDIYSCGGALISKPLDSNRSYIGHAIIEDREAAIKKIENYYSQGIRDIKIYYRLRYPEVKAVIKRAIELKMNICGHIDMNIIRKDSLLKLGLKEFEHAHTFGIEALSEDEANEIWTDTIVNKYKYQGTGQWFAWQMEFFNYLGKNNEKIFYTLKNLKNSEASITPTIHIFALPIGLSYFKPSDPEERTVIDAPICDTRNFTFEQKERCIKGFNILMSYVKKMYDLGIQLNLGTDWAEGGKAALSEMILFNKAGIPMKDVLRIATINSAKAINRDHLYGSIEKGKRANLIIFDENPLENCNNLLDSKLIIKDGIVFN